MEEDTKLMNLFASRFAVDALCKKNEELELELKRAFELVNSQNTTIRQYRTLLRDILDKTSTLSPTTTVKRVHDDDKEEECTDHQQKRQKIAGCDTLTTDPKPYLPKVVPKSVMEHCTQVYTLAGPVTRAMPEKKDPPVVVEPHPPSLPIRLQTPPSLPATAQEQPSMLRFGDIIEDKRIRLVTRERPDGLSDADLLIFRVVWNTIVDFFNSNPNANLMDENMIIQMAGQSLLGGGGLLSRSVIHKYFNHPFTFQDSDKTITIRTRLVKGKPVWLVFIPDWLKSEWRTAGKPI